tara:strand:+ start:603 stop:1364 length:762 start_codon:yes stop_codon:yes gene_type:complete
MESKRLLIKKERLDCISESNDYLILNEEEIHYIRRVLRLKEGSFISIIDGQGHFWKSTLISKSTLQLHSKVENPYISLIRKKPLIKISIVPPKRGFDDFLRMSTEIGVDVIQLINSERCSSSLFNEKYMRRFHGIINEAVLQSERLWKPELLKKIELHDLFKIKSANSLDLIAIARGKSLRLIYDINIPEVKNNNLNELAILIGPEGGWSKGEEASAIRKGFEKVSLGNSILKTSTAGVVASHCLVNLRSISN